MDKMQISTCVLFKTREDPAELFNFSNKTLNQITLFIKLLIILALYDTIRLGWNHGGNVMVLKIFQHFVTIIRFI